MAPALTVTPAEPFATDEDQPAPQRRRALASVDNLAASMDEDDMGLHAQPSLAKDQQEMDQILGELGSSDLAQADLLQAIKTFEGGGDILSTGDPDGIFPLSGLDLTDTIDSEGDAAEDKVRLLQARLERRCAFLQRRLRILQVRAIGKRISEEAIQTFDKCTRGARKDGCGRPMGLKALLKKIETTAALQASAASRSVVGPKYYRASTSKGDASRSASVGIPSGTLAGLEDTAGALRSHLSIVKHELDSDATLSSSGAESNDEAVTYNNPQQQHMPIEKRALWSWQRARASIASRWCWLQAQVQELDYKIRQHGELHKQVREAKGRVEFEGEPVNQEDMPAPELPDDDPSLETCARHRPLKRETFKKRKLLQMHNLHLATTKAAKPSDIKCNCYYPVESCPVCVGRAEPTEPLPSFSTLSPSERVALVDPGFHPVLSDVKDIRPSVHLAALVSRPWFRTRGRGGRGGRAPPPAHAHANTLANTLANTHTNTHAAAKHKKHPTRLKRGRPPLSRKVREREREREEEGGSPGAALGGTGAGPQRARGRPSTETRSSRRHSFDIDNIVIPQSVAANTRPQILTYKEIITPKWRVLELPAMPLNNGVMKISNRMSTDDRESEEDISEAAVRERHARCEASERSRFIRNSRSRRQHEAAGEFFAPPPPPPPPPPPQPLPPPPPTTPPPQPSHDAYETVRPYTPRQFPLPEDTYLDMLSVMPDGYRASPSRPAPPSPRSPRSPPSAPSPSPSPAHFDDDDDDITLSPLSPTVFDGDDPDDVEWDPNTEKAERRKSAFR